MSELNSVVLGQKPDGSWQATHIPSGKVAHGLSEDEAKDAMKILLDMSKDGEFLEPKTSPRFDGVGKDIAEFLEGQVSDMLSLHSGYARLEAYENSVAHVRLGGGCKGCPSSLMTLLSGVKEQLQEQFGEDSIMDVYPFIED